MRAFLKKYLWILLIIVLIGIAVDLFNSVIIFSILLFSLALISISFFIQHRQIKRIIFFLGIFILLNVLINSYAFIGLLVVIFFIIVVFQTNQGNELFWIHEAFIHPFKVNRDYIGVKLVRPQIEQRSLVYKQPLLKQYIDSDVYKWNDINILSIGGDSVIDLGTTILPEGESIILIRKMFGRTRVIIPHDIGLKVNISLVKGNVIYDQTNFSLLNDNFHFESEEYAMNTRKIRIVLSSIMGNVEVIRL